MYYITGDPVIKFESYPWPFLDNLEQAIRNHDEHFNLQWANTGLNNITSPGPTTLRMRGESERCNVEEANSYLEWLLRKAIEIFNKNAMYPIKVDGTFKFELKE